jgi:acetolactate synthase I/II/III large subunit
VPLTATHAWPVSRPRSGPGQRLGQSAQCSPRRHAGTPVVNIVGDQATYHRPLDPPLTADTEGWARGVSGWVRTSIAARTVGGDAAAAVQASMIAPGQVATLILPSDTSWNDGGVVAEALPRLPSPSSSPNQIEAAAEALRRGGAGVVLLLGGVALYEEGLALAHRIQAATGCRVISQGSNARMARGQGRLSLERVPYVVDVAVRAMAGTKHLILVGSRKPVTFFAYPNTVQSSIPDDAEIHILARPEQDVVEALARLVDALDCPNVAPPDNGMRPETGRGALTADSVAATLGALMPENAVIADESVSFGRGFFANTKASPPHDWLNVTGGAIGGGMPMATGAALGAPGRRVINLQADGSAMYTLQALWTQAREKSDITTVLLSNRKYQILLGELANVGANPGRTALDMMDIGNPDINWPSLAQSMGVEAAGTDTAEGFADLLAHAVKRSGPFLIELLI